MNGEHQYSVKWKYHHGTAWKKLCDLQCLEAILYFESFGLRSTSNNELKECKVTSDNHVFVEW